MENKKVEIAFADPTPTILFIFTMLCMMFWAQFAGVCSPNTTLFLGLIQLGCVPAYLICSYVMLSKGDGVSGNIFLIFATAFGAIGGLVNLFSFMAPYFGWPVDSSIVGFTWLWSGLITLPISLCIRKGSPITFLVFFLAVFQLAIMGLVTLGVLVANIWVVIATYLCIIIGIGGFYCAVAALFEYAGINLPMGKPLFK